MFTLADVEAAVEATGLTPHSGSYVERDGKQDCLCPASILVVAKHGPKAVGPLKRAKSGGYVKEHVTKKLGHFGATQDELVSFTGGVDGTSEYHIDVYLDGEYTPECKKAYELGQAVRKRYSLK